MADSSVGMVHTEHPTLTTPGPRSPTASLLSAHMSGAESSPLACHAAAADAAVAAGTPTPAGCGGVAGLLLTDLAPSSRLRRLDLGLPAPPREGGFDDESDDSLLVVVVVVCR